MNATTSSSQRGAVLLSTVMLLVMLTILALAAFSLNTTQTRVATNSADSMVAFQTAEGTLAQVENALIGGTYSDSSFAANQNGLYILDPTADPVWKNPAIWTSTSAVLQGFQGGSNAPSAYVIEKLPPVPKPGISTKTAIRVYRITVRATGKSGGSPVMLQSTVSLQ
ncbi:pilus assembly PilX family protein [Variovorax sp. PBL-E5]|uniref:pilus assembly PilX family protein n=2 Tax=unclassified Variovorax TaxID=663243 RepID=UPI0013177FAA|nr:pilus assembly protein PilX [Variovorax sp. PBL-E5]VTU22820.1 Tfp pilus assembly protein PilX [Variovorax sp. PBL-E5]